MQFGVIRVGHLGQLIWCSGRPQQWRKIAPRIAPLASGHLFWRAFGDDFAAAHAAHAAFGAQVEDPVGLDDLGFAMLDPTVPRTVAPSGTTLLSFGSGDGGR